MDTGGSPDREAVVWVYPLKQTVQLVGKHQSGLHLEEARPSTWYRGQGFFHPMGNYHNMQHACANSLKMGCSSEGTM